MSFSGEVKRELAGRMGKSRHCRIAELAALISFEGKAAVENGRLPYAESENEIPAEKFRLLAEKLFQKDDPGGDLIRDMLEAVKMWDETTGQPADASRADDLLLQKDCCRRAFIRGALLAGGSISNPNKSYHFEIVCKTEAQAGQLKEVINSFEMDAKIVERKKHFIVYLKEGSQIVDILNIMEAHVALMNLENVRILKEMRNSVNRKVNCETANISKTVNAAVKQIEDIVYIRDTAGLSGLPENLREIAELRLEYPEAPLKELGTYLNPPVGKSGVNHRLRKLSIFADELRGNGTQNTAARSEGRGWEQL